MKQTFLSDLLNVAKAIEIAYEKLALVEALKERFKAGEALTLSLKAGDTELTQTVFNSNEKTPPLESLFAMLEATSKNALYEISQGFQTILDVENA